MVADLCPTNAPRGTIDRLSHQTRQDSECSTNTAILAAEVRGKKLIERQADVAIYAGPIPGAYELIRIRVAEESILNGKVIPRREVYPPAESWGISAWTFSRASHAHPLEAARRKMKMLLRSAGPLIICNHTGYPSTGKVLVESVQLKHRVIDQNRAGWCHSDYNSQRAGQLATERPKPGQTTR